MQIFVFTPLLKQNCIGNFIVYNNNVHTYRCQYNPNSYFQTLNVTNIFNVDCRYYCIILILIDLNHLPHRIPNF